MNQKYLSRFVSAVAVLFALSAASRAQDSAGMKQGEIKMHNGRPMVFINGVPDALPSYSPVSMRRRDTALSQTERFFPHRMGAYYVTIPSIQFTDWAYFSDTPFWKGDETSSQPLAKAGGNLDLQVQHIVQGDPGANIIVRFGAHEPKTWRDLHPDEQFVTEDGKRLDVPSLASTLYQTMAARYCKAVIGYCEARPWANRIIGYANFERMEGTHEPIVNGWLYDHSPVMTARWRRYLRDKYRTVDALRLAHNNPALTFETATVPRDWLRAATPEVSGLLYWQGAKANQPLRDYLLLSRDLYHANLRSLTGAMKAGIDSMGRKRFLIYDTLKLSMLGWSNAGFFDPNLSWPLAFPEDRAGSGHLGVASLFNASGMDGLITPHDYQARGAGGVFEPEGSADSAVLRGKLFTCEMDTRTYTGTDVNFPARNDKEFAAVTWRNFATAWTRGFHAYWMDVYQDWFASEGIHQVIERQVQVQKESVNWQHQTVPGIAMILDDEAILETNGSGNVFNESILWEQKMGLARCGVPFRIYLLDDLKLENFPKHRVFYFPNLYRIDAERLQLLQQKVFRDGNVVLWGPGSGISDGSNIGPDSASRLTGFSFNQLNSNYQRRTLVTDFAHPITRGLPADTVLGGPLAYGPTLYPKDGTELGRAWAKGGRDWSGLAAKNMPGPGGGWKSVFSTTVNFPASFWRNLARFGGAHVYTETNDILLADSTLVALHSAQSGRKKITLPGTYSVYDVVTGKLVGHRLRAIEFQLNAPETRVFRLE